MCDEPLGGLGLNLVGHLGAMAIALLSPNGGPAYPHTTKGSYYFTLTNRDRQESVCVCLRNSNSFVVDSRDLR